jgi:hypothetical protein
MGFNSGFKGLNEKACKATHANRMFARHHCDFEMNWSVFTKQKNLATCVQLTAVLNDCNVAVGRVGF